jgi:hypothetical protein
MDTDFFASASCGARARRNWQSPAMSKAKKQSLI